MGSGLSGGPLTGQPVTAALPPAPAGTSAVLSGPLGSSSGDVVTKIGSTVADGSVNAAAKLTSFRTGIGGTEVEKLVVLKSGQLVGDGGLTSSAGSTVITLNENSFKAMRAPANISLNEGGGASAQLYTTTGTYTGIEVSSVVNLYVANANVARVASAGRFDQSGTDSSGTPGAATIDKPTGKSAIAIGAASVVITNNLVTAASRVMITPQSRDATCKELIAVPGAGSFTVSGSANATAALVFSWEISNIL